MSDLNSNDEAAALDKLSAVEGEIRDLVRRDATLRRAPAERVEQRVDARLQPDMDARERADTGNLGSLLQRVSGHSVQEIDRLIAELTALRAKLAQEGERVAREVVEFATMSEAAMRSTRLIADSLGYLKKVPDAPSISE
jgi:hypothetical protein